MSNTPHGEGDFKEYPHLSWTDPPVSQSIIELDHVYEALSHPRRRYLCYSLLERTEWSLMDLATKIAAWEHDIDEAETTEHQCERVYVALYHAHVPRLVDDDIIHFDERQEIITPAENAEQVLSALHGMSSTLALHQDSLHEVR